MNKFIQLCFDHWIYLFLVVFKGYGSINGSIQMYCHIWKTTCSLDLQHHSELIMGSRLFLLIVTKNLLGLIREFSYSFEEQIGFEQCQFPVSKRFLWNTVLKMCILFDQKISRYSLIFRLWDFLGELCALLRIEGPMFWNSPIIIIEFPLLNKLHAAEETLSWAEQFRRLMGARPQRSLHHLFIPLACVLSGGLSEAVDSVPLACWESHRLLLGGGESVLPKSPGENWCWSGINTTNPFFFFFFFLLLPFGRLF